MALQVLKVPDILAMEKPTKLALVVKPKRRNRRWELELAKSGRSCCAHCKAAIDKDTLRLGVVTYYPHRNVRWHHFPTCSQYVLAGASLDLVKIKSMLTEEQKEILEDILEGLQVPAPSAPIATLTGGIDLYGCAGIMTGRYGRFRSFTFGLPLEERYTQNWNWRCFLATMLVCNSRETSMLAVTDKLFKSFPTEEALLSIADDETERCKWKTIMEEHDLRHVGNKINNILEATKCLKEEHQGEIPTDRRALEKMRGVGRHVSSVTLAWVHEQAEFGIDVHVRRIMTRLGYVDESMNDIAVEAIVKSLVPENKIGHFSRALVDHGQQICGYTPNCEACFLKSSCPTAAKHLDW